MTRAALAAGVIAGVLSGPTGAGLGASIPVVGAADVIRGARVIGPVAPTQRLHITVTLRPRDRAALIAYATAVATPGSAEYRHYLSPSQFARRFGAPAGRVALVQRWLRSRGLGAGPVSRGALSIPVAATVGRLQRALGISLRRLALPGSRRAMAARSAPVVPSAVAGAVQSLVGLNTVARRPLMRRPALGAGGGAGRGVLSTGHVATGGPQPCPAARSAAGAQSAYTADQIASAYGLARPYGTGNTGAGTTVAMYELEPVSAADLATYEACYGLHSDVSYVGVDGGAGSGGGSGEAALDIENFLSLAPSSRLLVYQGPNSNSGNPGSGPYDTFSAIVNQDRAQVVSVSWGECETALGAADAGAEGTLFAQAAIQGQTIVAAAGDSGSADCNPAAGPAQTQLAVDDPASQPTVTGVGGTTLSTLGPRPAESVWNDAGRTAGSALQPGAGGGGVSSFWAMPAAQRSAAPGLNVLGGGLTGSTCGVPSGYCRQVPDVAANANPATGYLIYYNGDRSNPGQPAGWQVIGGTSGGAPVWAALFALADSSPACAGSSIGDALPSLYRAAGAAYGAGFNDVTSGNNDFIGAHDGRYPAGPGYDEASGLGTPNAAELVSALCVNALRLDLPRDQRASAHAIVTLRLHAAQAPGSVVRFVAHGLPTGLRLATDTGLISGSPRRHGRYRVQVTASDGAATVEQRFVWTIGTPALVRDPSITGVTRTPVLSLIVAAGRGSPPLSRLALALPRSLSLGSTRGIRVTAAGVPMSFRARRLGGTLTLMLANPVPAVTVLVTAPGLNVAAGRRPLSVRGDALRVVITDASGGVSSVRIRPRVS